MAARALWAIRVGRGSVAATLSAGATAIALGTAMALLGFVWPDLGGDFSEPSAGAPSAVELIVSLPVIAPVLLVSTALLLAAVAAAMMVSADRRRATLLRCGLLVVGPLLVLVGAEVVPHLATPCWAGEVPAVCEATEEHGIDYADSVHPLGHALLGWVPLVVLHVWVLRRWWPDVVPRWVPGGDSASDALAEP